MNLAIISHSARSVTISEADILIESISVLVILCLLIAVSINARLKVANDRVIYFDKWLSIIWAKVCAMHVKYNSTSKTTAELEEAKCRAWFYLNRSEIKQKLTDDGVLEDGWGVKSVIIEAVYDLYCEEVDSEN